ncbi:hypothetical protein H2203_002498 [Taxawa tesnikishii (nom. ined.)]|nr:hypothetical protein H2203_002498 [Dothideales sp. JES 119]
MTVKWGPVEDQFILNTIFTNPSIKIDTQLVAKAVVETWPANKEKPTQRAVSERLVRLRKAAATSVAGGMSAPIASTPKTPRTTTTTPAKTPKSASKRRTPASGKKRKANDSDDHETDSTIVKKELNELEDPFNLHPTLSESMSAKRQRRSTSAAALKYAEDGDEGDGGESAVSVFGEEVEA